ncbi:hypothetical protein DIPPA_23219 [Diplonema papillatum]|nr:hypothetical protein DIPPA_23219 [Diplonema papillatum]
MGNPLRTALMAGMLCVVLVVFLGSEVLELNSRLGSQVLAARPLPVDMDVTVLVVASFAHREVLLNWLVASEQHQIRDVSIICLDDRLNAWLVALGGQCTFNLRYPEDPPFWKTKRNRRCAKSYHLHKASLPECKEGCSKDQMCAAVTYDSNLETCSWCHRGFKLDATDDGVSTAIRANLAHLWKARIDLIRSSTESGKDIIISDLDAVWLLNPLREIRQAALTADIVTQRGTFPKDISKRWGATLCMGFAYFKASHAVVEFLKSVDSFVDESGDDQDAMNRALLAANVTWRDAPLAVLNNTSQDKATTQTGMQVVLLPHSRFPRHCPAPLPPTTVVAHCFDKGVSKSDPTEKIARARSRGLWVLADDWKKRYLRDDFGAYLRSLRK